MARGFAEPALVSDQAASRLAPPGFDPARERLTEAETEVYFLLRKYRVQTHYLASSADKVTRYAVFAHGEGQVTEPAPHAIAKEEADRLTAKAIVQQLSRSAQPFVDLTITDLHPPSNTAEGQ